MWLPVIMPGSTYDAAIERHLLLKGVDQVKDQSYALYHLKSGYPQALFNAVW